MKIRNKRGWIRIMEAVVAILIMASVLIVLYTNNTPQVSYAQYISDLQIRILDDVALSPELRNATLFSNETYIQPLLNNSVFSKVPSNFDYALVVCSLTNSNCVFPNNLTQEVYVEDRIISSNLQNYNPKILRFFIWSR